MLPERKRRTYYRKIENEDEEGANLILEYARKNDFRGGESDEAEEHSSGDEDDEESR